MKAYIKRGSDSSPEPNEIIRIEVVKKLFFKEYIEIIFKKIVGCPSKCKPKSTTETF